MIEFQNAADAFVYLATGQLPQPKPAPAPAAIPGATEAERLFFTVVAAGTPQAVPTAARTFDDDLRDFPDTTAYGYYSRAEYKTYVDDTLASISRAAGLASFNWRPAIEAAARVHYLSAGNRVYQVDTPLPGVIENIVARANEPKIAAVWSANVVALKAGIQDVYQQIWNNSRDEKSAAFTKRLIYAAVPLTLGAAAYFAPAAASATSAGAGASSTAAAAAIPELGLIATPATAEAAIAAGISGELLAGGAGALTLESIGAATALPGGGSISGSLAPAPEIAATAQASIPELGLIATPATAEAAIAAGIPAELLAGGAGAVTVGSAAASTGIEGALQGVVDKAVAVGKGVANALAGTALGKAVNELLGDAPADQAAPQGAPQGGLSPLILGGLFLVGVALAR